jgi:hypothetical protein
MGACTSLAQTDLPRPDGRAVDAETNGSADAAADNGGESSPAGSPPVSGGENTPPDATTAAAPPDAATDAPPEAAPPPLVCAGGMADCDGLPANGCETAIVDNPDHCGSCSPCEAGYLCAGMTCQWTPAVIKSQLTFWFDPTSLVTFEGKVPKWTDRSGHGNDAVQAMTGRQPTYTAAGIGGLPSATFRGPVTFLRIADSPAMQWGTSDLVILAVSRAVAGTAHEAMLYQKTGSAPYDGASLYLNADKPTVTALAAAQLSGATYVVSAAPPTTFVDGTPHLLAVRRVGTRLEVRVDGAVSKSLEAAEVATVDVSSKGFDAIIGQNGYNPAAEFQQLHGDIAEMIGVDGPLSEVDLDNLERYLKRRYGIP